VQCSCSHTLGVKFLGKSICAALRSHKHDRATFASTNPSQHLIALFLLDDKHMVLHGAVSCLTSFDRMFNRIAQVLFHKSVHIAIQCCTEQKSLTAGVRSVQNLFHIRHKTHVTHEICFIKDCDFNIAQINGAPVHEVNKATRCGNNNRDCVIKCLELLTEWHASCNKHR